MKLKQDEDGKYVVQWTTYSVNKNLAIICVFVTIVSDFIVQWVFCFLRFSSPPLVIEFWTL